MYQDLEKRLDGSYTFTKNGLPYNCPNSGEWVAEYAEVDAWAKANPDQVAQEVPYVPSAEEINAQRVETIKQALQSIDIHSARAMRAIINGTATDEDRAYLAEEEAKAVELRAELATLQGA